MRDAVQEFDLLFWWIRRFAIAICVAKADSFTQNIFNTKVSTESSKFIFVNDKNTLFKSKNNHNLMIKLLFNKHCDSYCKNGYILTEGK